jgi:signal transduction histidine kinase
VQADNTMEASTAEAEEFMSVAAHDLRNPIAVMRASAQMAQRQMQRGDLDMARSRLNAIVEQTDRLTEMIETFLDAARIDAGRLRLVPEQVDLTEIVQDALARARMAALESANREVILDLPQPCVGSWDRVRTVRAVRALVANALIYGDQLAPVRITAARANNAVRLSISGGGHGPDAEEMEHLFERFYRGPSASEAGQAGSGLGLFIARGIARRQGGEVRRLHGDTFELELPLL